MTTTAGWISCSRACWLANQPSSPKWYHNNGNGRFTLNTNAVLPGVIAGSAAWGDYDNDGWLDILLTGGTAINGDGYPIQLISQVYHNNGNGTFALSANAALPGVAYSSVEWGDYNNDGRLDILLTGEADSAFDGFSQIYANFTSTTNTPPTAPTGLTATVLSNYASLAWMAASDLQTPSPGLTYDLRMGTTPGGSDLLAPQSDPASGRRRLPQMGNAGEGTNAVVNISGFPGGATCYWSAQAVDSAFAGSPFAVEGSFIVPPRPPIAITLAATNMTATQATLRGTVNPSGLPTLSWFEWGTTANYGSFTAESFSGQWQPGGDVERFIDRSGSLHRLPLSY